MYSVLRLNNSSHDNRCLSGLVRRRTPSVSFLLGTNLLGRTWWLAAVEVRYARWSGDQRAINHFTHALHRISMPADKTYLSAGSFSVASSDSFRWRSHRSAIRWSIFLRRLGLTRTTRVAGMNMRGCQSQHAETAAVEIFSVHSVRAE